jgi:acetyl esterase/lipase
MAPSPQYAKVRRLLLERRRATPASSDVAELRERLASAALPAGDDIRVNCVEVAGIAAEHVMADGSRDDQAMLYLHGGGFCLGSAMTHRKLAGDLSRAAGCGAYVLDYRLAPEHPLPAAVDDAVNAYQALLERHAPESLLVAGDSAGGTLAVLTAIRLRDAGSSLPAGVVALTPWVDYRCEDRSYVERADGDPITLVPELGGYADWFLDGHDPADPIVCPLSADLRGLPPILTHGGTGDVMCNDAARLADRARSAGVDVTHRQVPEMLHVWHVFAGRVPESTEAVSDVGSFARRRFGEYNMASDSVSFEHRTSSARKEGL